MYAKHPYLHDNPAHRLFIIVHPCILRRDGFHARSPVLLVSTTAQRVDARLAQLRASNLLKLLLTGHRVPFKTGPLRASTVPDISAIVVTVVVAYHCRFLLFYYRHRSNLESRLSDSEDRPEPRRKVLLDPIIDWAILMHARLLASTATSLSLIADYRLVAVAYDTPQEHG